MAYGIRTASLAEILDGSRDVFMVNVERSYGVCGCERFAGG